MNIYSLLAGVVFVAVLIVPPVLPAFEGRITAAQHRGGDVQTFVYIVGTNTLRLERGETNLPYAENLFALDSDTVTILFTNNRSFVRQPELGGNQAPVGMPGKSPMSNLSPGLVGGGMPAMPASLENGLGSQPGMLPMPSIPPMPSVPMMGRTLELKATRAQTNLLGFNCERFELKQRGEIMEIWATDQLLPFHAWQPDQSPRLGFGPLEDQWSGLIQAKKLFPLLAVLRFEGGGERLRFEVRTITPEKIADVQGTLFQPPAGYRERPPLPF